MDGFYFRRCASTVPSSPCFYPVQVSLPLGGEDVKLELIRVNHPTLDLHKPVDAREVTSRNEDEEQDEF